MSQSPKIRLPYAGSPLRLVEKESADDAPAAQMEQTVTLYRGIAYSAQQWREWLATSDGNTLPDDALIGGFHFDSHCGETLPVTETGPVYCWDSLSPPGATIAENEFQLLSASLEGLAIETGIDCAMLSISPHFAIRFTTRACAAQLGEIRLVSAKRFATDTDGMQHTLLDTGDAAPVLYLEDEHDTTLIRQRSDWQARDSEAHFNFDYRVGQVLQRDMLGLKVQSVTVLEQYSSFFMQRALAAGARDALWVPACAPVSWGWSLRVEPEAEGWIITRRKLIPPVVGHDGWQMPQWQGNTTDYRAH